MTFISYAQNFEDVILWRALKDVKDGFYIDIGSEHPFTDSVSYAFSLHNWNGLSVDTNPEYFEEFKAARPNDPILQAFVSDEYTDNEFFIFTNTGLSTADQKIANMHVNNGLSHKKILVKSITLDDVFKKASRDEIHWLKIDVEGYEKNVLNGWSSNYRPWIVLIEAMEPNKQVSTHKEWEDLLLKKGYVFVYADGLNRFYLHNDHLDLKDFFQYPPNPLNDDFKKNEHTDDCELKFLHELIRNKNEALKEKQEWLENYDEQLKDAQQQIQSKDEALKEKQKWLENYDEQLKDAQQQIQSKDEALKEKQEWLENYDAQLNQAQQEIQNKDNALKEKQEWLEIYDAQLKDAQQEIQNKDNALKEKQEWLESYDAQLKDAQQQIQNKDNALKEKQERLKNYDEEIKSLNEKLKDVYNSTSWKITKPLRLIKDGKIK